MGTVITKKRRTVPAVTQTWIRAVRKLQSADESATRPDAKGTGAGIGVRRAWAFLFPEEAERDGGFRAELLRLCRQGLWVIAAVEIAVPVFMLLAQFLVLRDPLTSWRIRGVQAASVMVVGMATALAARAKPELWMARAFGWLSGLASGMILIISSLLLHGRDEAGDHYIPGQITMVLLVGLGALPFRPIHTFSLCMSLWICYVLAGWTALRWDVLTGLDADGTQGIFILMITLLSMALTAVLYAERRGNYLAHQDAIRASESLCRAQSRVLLAENAASLGRLAAALSHELNNPVGALRSAVDTMLLLAARQATSPPEEHQRLVVLQADLRRSINDSARRLHQIVARLQRFTNLDKADIQPADVNGLVGDVVALVEPEVKGTVKVELDLQPVRPLLCRPQQLSAVFTSLLHNAIEAIQNGDGRVRIFTLDQGSQVEIRISDTGRGMPAEELATIFDPGFKITGARVRTGNWSLFSSRQIVREHGGDIHIQSVEGQGTTVSVMLPRLSEAELEHRSPSRS